MMQELISGKSFNIALISRNNQKRLGSDSIRMTHAEIFESFQAASKEDRQTRFASSIRSTIRQVRIDYPYVNWLTFLNECLNGIQTVNENDIVLVLDPNYFRKLGSIIQKNGNRRIANYFAILTIVYAASRLHVNYESVDVSAENCLLSTKEK